MHPLFRGFHNEALVVSPSSPLSLSLSLSFSSSPSSSLSPVAATRKKVGKETETGSILDDDTHEATATAAVPVATEEGNFLDDVIRVLLNARRVLSASYCIGYFLPPESMDLNGAHETLQVVQR